MRRAGLLMYNVIVYLFILGVTIYGICFLGNLGIVQSIDANPQMPLVPALLIDGSLLFLFVLFKRAKSNTTFRRIWNSVVPPAIEKTTNTLLSGILAALTLREWEPIGRVVWEIDSSLASNAIYVFYFCGWLIILSGFVLNYKKDVFGLNEWWSQFRNQSQRKRGFGSHFFHKLIRNPFFFGILVCLWAAPVMTVSHLFFAMLITLYVMTVFQLEEKNVTVNFREREHSERSRVSGRTF